MKFCSAPGCPVVVARGRCAMHRAARGSARARGYTSAWDRYSKARLSQHPWCAGYPSGCHAVPTLATCTDHIRSARGWPDLFWEVTNHQSLCDDCHRRKTVAEDGGFGR
jgi:5-methylcytosine-specific restriction protein A